jgi:hypothetical protein
VRADPPFSPPGLSRCARSIAREVAADAAVSRRRSYFEAMESIPSVETVLRPSVSSSKRARRREDVS